MAGTPLGASAPTLPTSEQSPKRPTLQAASTRTRRHHGDFPTGSAVSTLHSSRRQTDGLGVTLTVGAGSLALTSQMTPTQARAVARGLLAAATAADQAQGGAA